MYVQYPDLTELRSSNWYSANDSIANPNASKTFNVKTQFAFCTVMSKHGITGENTKAVEWLTKMGFKRINSMLNWWPTHWRDNNKSDERSMDFWWKKYDENKEPVDNQFVARQCWGGNEYPWLKGLIAATGCAFKIGHYPLKKNLYYRFFSLLRLTKPPTKMQVRRLTAMNFIKIDEGFMAEYWLNGWPFESYSNKMEHDFWDKHDPKGELRAPTYSGF